MKVLRFLVFSAAVPLVTLAAAPAHAGHPMLGVSVSNSYMADDYGERHPERCEMTIVLNELPGYIPLISTGGLDFCAGVERMQLDDEAPPIDTGTVTVFVHRLNRKGRWRRVVRIPKVSIEGNLASKCERSYKKLDVGTTIRWRFDFAGMPHFGYLDGLVIEGAILTGGASDFLDSRSRLSGPG